MHIGAGFVAENRFFALPPLDGISPIDVHFLWNPETNLTRAEEVFKDFALEILEKEGI